MSAGGGQASGVIQDSGGGLRSRIRPGGEHDERSTVGHSRADADQADLDLPANLGTEEAVTKILDLLVKAVVLDPEYNI